MSYSGYRIIINGITIWNSLISKGTYQAVPQKRIAASWEDANLISHEEVLSNRKMDISFALRERSLEEQESIMGIFALEENVPVTYWDDKTCTYKTGTFKMEAPKFQHRNTIGGINYNPTTIHLIEY